jgi:transportin-1
LIVNDQNLEVKTEVCRALVALTAVRIGYLLPHINDVAKYMILFAESNDTTLAMEACEFWTALSETKYCKQVARDHLNK